MADILRFAGFRTNRSAVAGGLIDDDMVRVDLLRAAAPQGAPAAPPLDDGRGDHAGAASTDGAPTSGRHDWSNQELADLYRVEALLVQANIRIETMRGVSDEGDPWFVFCHADGEVFVHLARIDGVYVLDGPGMDAVLSGPSFAALIERFAGAVAARAPRGNIVQFRSGSTDSVVRLHPAVMLAALVWSLYLASDHMVGSARADELDAGDGAAGHDGHAPLFPSLEGPAADVHAEADKALVRLDGEAAGRGKAPAGDDLHRLIAREAELSRAAAASADGSSWNMASSATGIAAGLTAIAVSFGLYDSKFAEHAHDAARPAVAEALPAAPDPAHAVSLQADFATPDRAMTKGRDAVAAPEVAVKAEPVALHVQEGPPVHLTAEVTVLAAAAAKASLPEPIEKAAPQVKADAPASQASTLAKVVAVDDAKDAKALVDFATEHLGQVSTYKLAGLSVDATFDVSTLSQQTAQLVLADLAGQQDGAGKAPADTGGTLDSLPPVDVIAQYLPGDAAAKTFVYQFLLKSPHSIEMIQSGNTIVFLDTTVADDPGDRAYSVSWIWDDHTIVSTIGHAQDFANLPLA